MTETPILDPSDELGQVDAIEDPDSPVGEDVYVEDPDYDPENDEIDPDTISEGLGEMGPEVPSEGGDI